MPQKMRALLDAFVAGLNAYLADHPEVRPRLLTRFEPWYPLAFIRFNYYQSGFFWGAGFQPSDLQVAMDDALVGSTHLGSNGGVIGPTKSATGHSMLFINPHLSFFGYGQVYEGHVKSDEGWNFTGYTRLGFPFPYVGHNESLGWVSTDNAADQADLGVEAGEQERPRPELTHGVARGHERTGEVLRGVEDRRAAGPEEGVRHLANDRVEPVERLVHDLAAQGRARPFAEQRQLLEPEDALVLALDEIQDPHNLGAVCRVAESAGCSGVVLPER